MTGSILLTGGTVTRQVTVPHTSRRTRINLFFVVILGGYLTQFSVLAQAPTPFTCTNGASYVTKTTGATNTNTGLFSFNMSNGTYTSIASPLTVTASSNKVDAIGYNVVDNFIWGSATGTNRVVKIGSNGATQDFAVTGLPAASYTAGDVDANGYLYLYASGSNSLYKINLNGTPTLTTTYTLSPTYQLNDISVNSAGTTIYGIGSSSGNLITISLSGGNATSSSTPMSNIPSGGTWNTFLDESNNLYLQESEGKVYRITPPYGNANVKLVSDNVPTTFNSDGARCRNAKIQSDIEPTPFTCQQQVSFVSKSPTTTNINTGLYSLNIATGVYTAISQPIIFDSSVDAIAYNPIDNFIWGAVGSSNSVVKIGANGSHEVFTVAGLPVDTYAAGAIDASGNMYLYSGVNGGKIYKVNLTTVPSPTLTNTYTYTSATTPTLSDFVVSPDGTTLRGIRRGTGDLAVITLSGSTATQTTVSTVTLPSDNNWNLSMDSNGDLYAQNATNGNVNRISAPLYNHVQQVSTLASGTSNSDGTGCPTALLTIAPVTFSCGSLQYQVTAATGMDPSTLWRYNNITGIRTAVKVLNVNVNAIGYNVKDNFIWGYSRDKGVVVKLDATGAFTEYLIPNLPKEIYFVGDVSLDGYYYLLSEADNKTIYVIDLDPSRPTYLQLVNPDNGFAIFDTTPYGMIGSHARIIHDWAFNPTDNQLYAVLSADAPNANHVITVNPLTGISSHSAGEVEGGLIKNGTPNFGAVFFDNEGNFYVVNNTSGNFYRLDLSTLKATLLTDKPTGITSNDGAGCALAPPIPIDMGDAPDSYGTLLNDGGPVHILSANLKIGSLVDDELDGFSSSLANGDDLDQTDDEDGIGSFPELLVSATSYSVSVNVTNTTGNTAILAGWIDFNNNGAFDSGERTEVAIANGQTSATLTWNGLTGLSVTNTYVRIRLASLAEEVVSPLGTAADGEVEDYIIEIKPLPVTLASFNVRSENEVSLLNWTTTEETNTDRFEVERSGDAKSWVKIGVRHARGESKSLVDYAYTDNEPLNGINYYRLKMIDLDHTYTYSRIRSIHFDIPAVVYPNPTDKLIFLNTSKFEVESYQIIRADGRVVSKGRYDKFKGIDVSKFPNGVYAIHFKGNKSTYIQKLLIQK
jgi:hypothetical protein